MPEISDRFVTAFNEGLPPDAPGCESCGGSIHAIQDRLDGVPIAVLDITHSDEDCRTLGDALTRFGGFTLVPDTDRLFVRHRFDGAARPLDEAAVAFFAGSATA